MDEKILKNIPTSPGIYQFFDAKKKIIYIGKSVNLKSRVNSYFNWKSKLNFAKRKMVEQIKEIKTIVTNNATESLILETTLIKKHKPKYNILMKDDKNHLYIKITKEPVPKIIKTRIKWKIWDYFGPYISSNQVNNILKIVKKNFGYRSCNIIFWEELGHLTIKSANGSKIPCIDYYIGRCAGPCLLTKDEIKAYREQIENIKLFLKGSFWETIKNMEVTMKKYASELRFEEAEKVKQDIISIRTLETNQLVRESVTGSYDIVNYLEKYNKNYIGLMEIRDNKITWYYSYEAANKLKEEKEVILKRFVENRFFENLENEAKKIIFLLPFDLEIEEWIDIETEIPKIGNKLELIKLCYKNVYEYAHKKHLASLSTKNFTKQTMKNLLETLGLKRINKTLLFECNDISHLSGSHTVASRSIIVNGKKDTSKYKKFKINSLEAWKIDDFDSMREIMVRRLKEIEKSWTVPDLIIIDGWKGQLSSVMQVIQDYKNLKDVLPKKEEDEKSINLINSLQLIWLAKREEEVFLPWETESIILDKWSEELRIIQAIRDEAHRFAITFNRDSRSKSMKKNILESLPGIWPKTRKKILKEFGSLAWLQKAKKGWIYKYFKCLPKKLWRLYQSSLK